MTLRIELKPENMFTLVIGTTEFKNMRQVSTWENFIKLQQQPTGEMCILMDTRGPMVKALDRAWDGFMNSENYLIPIAGSVKILEAAQKAERGQ